MGFICSLCSSKMHLSLVCIRSLRLLDQDIANACLAADANLRWDRVPFVIEAGMFETGSELVPGPGEEQRGLLDGGTEQVAERPEGRDPSGLQPLQDRP